MTNRDLIDKVGGIEKAREIVAGAPDGALSCGGEDGDCDYYRGGEYFDTDYSRWIEIYFETPLLHKIEDLRTAIAEHDVGFQEDSFMIVLTSVIGGKSDGRQVVCAQRKLSLLGGNDIYMACFEYAAEDYTLEYFGIKAFRNFYKIPVYVSKHPTDQQVMEFKKKALSYFSPVYIKRN